MLAALCLAGFVALYVLSKRSGPQSAMGGQTLMYAKVDAALNMMGSTPSSVELTQQTNAKAIVDQFYTAAKQRQVDRKLLQRNPFIFKQEVPRASKIEVPKATPKVDKVQDELKAALAAARQLKLQTVLVGKNPAALISDSLVTTGQTIRGWKVTKIEQQPGRADLEGPEARSRNAEVAAPAGPDQASEPGGKLVAVSEEQF